LPDRFDQFIKWLTSDVTIIKNAYKKDVIGAPVFNRSLTHEMKQSIIHSPAVKVSYFRVFSHLFKAALEEYRIAHPRASTKESRRLVTGNNLHQMTFNPTIRYGRSYGC
jgi:hypothetical protein